MDSAVPVDIQGLVFDVRIGGPEDGPAVLLLHGFPENSGMWAGVTPALQEAGLRTVAPDQRGYSPGARPDGVEAYSIHHVVADALGLLDALGLRTAHVLGHDWGAVVAWNLAVRHPDRVATLTAVSVPHPAAHAAALRTDPEQQRRSEYLAVFRRPDSEQLLLADGARRLRRMFGPVPADEFVVPLTEPGALTGPLNWYRAMSRADIEGLGPVTVPTTYVWGTDDLAVSRVAAEDCAVHVTGPYRFVELPGVSHWVPEQEPDVVADLALDRISGR
ncbi:MAG TPA: alpha/beta hydrolase [Mycobacteriales bacterium]|jgi:pimeloyl-ACP methyl ester carboxylesterase|nr:alpha/beta hydrolase [Mycobacteriales bacterium]